MRSKAVEGMMVGRRERERESGRTELEANNRRAKKERMTEKWAEGT